MRSDAKVVFRRVSLRADLIAEVEEYLSKSRRYRSIADFISDAIRRRLEELEIRSATEPIEQVKEVEVEGGVQDG
ncbi:MAG: hypothetical protein QXD04_02985 [Candidatus Bathyarchaeia archaeon]